MSQNKETVETYLEGFRRTDRTMILDCVTEDVEWEIPGFVHASGKEEFAKHIVDEGFTGSPVITVSRMTEAGDIVFVEGTVLAPREDGSRLQLVFCDIFEMEAARIRRLTSYLVQTGTVSAPA
jgi:ketosteroid isomerase-like protein